MPESSLSQTMLTLFLNDQPIAVQAGSMVSAALLNAGVACRVSVRGEQRTAVCGMGICFECRAQVDGVPHRRTCQLLCRDGMRVRTDA